MLLDNRICSLRFLLSVCVLLMSIINLFITTPHPYPRIDLSGTHGLVSKLCFRLMAAFSDVQQIILGCEYQHGQVQLSTGGYRRFTVG